MTVINCAFCLVALVVVGTGGAKKTLEVKTPLQPTYMESGSSSSTTFSDDDLMKLHISGVGR